MDGEDCPLRGRGSGLVELTVLLSLRKPNIDSTLRCNRETLMPKKPRDTLFLPLLLLRFLTQ